MPTLPPPDLGRIHFVPLSTEVTGIVPRLTAVSLSVVT